MNKVQLESIKFFRNNLFDDIDKCNELKKSYDFDSNFPQLMIITVKSKIVNDFLDILNLIIRKRSRLEDSDKSYCLNLMRRITKRCKIHVAQLKRFTPFATINGAVFESENYYKKLLSAIYRSILI